MRYLLVVFLGLIGCGPNSPKDFRYEGEAKCRELVSILERVETREEIIQAEPLLRKKFKELVTLILMVESYLETHPSAVALPASSHSDDLQYELKRIYKIPGCKEVLERVEKEPLIYLERNGLQKAPSALS